MLKQFVHSEKSLFDLSVEHNLSLSRIKGILVKACTNACIFSEAAGLTTDEAWMRRSVDAIYQHRSSWTYVVDVYLEHAKAC